MGTYAKTSSYRIPAQLNDAGKLGLSTADTNTVPYTY